MIYNEYVCDFCGDVLKPKDTLILNDMGFIEPVHVCLDKCEELLRAKIKGDLITL